MTDDRSSDDKPRSRPARNSAEPSLFTQLSKERFNASLRIESEGDLTRSEAEAKAIRGENDRILRHELARLEKKKRIPSSKARAKNLIRIIRGKKDYLPKPTADWKDGNFTVKVGPGLSPEKVEAALTALADYFRACGGIGFEFEAPSSEEGF